MLPRTCHDRRGRLVLEDSAGAPWLVYESGQGSAFLRLARAVGLE